MDTLSNYNIRGYRFIQIFFWLLLLFATAVIILLIVLKINDTVSFREGQVIADNPQANYIAPADAEVVQIFVQEGRPVKKGDTMMQLRNIDMLQQQAKTKAEIKYLQDKIASGKNYAGLLRNDYEMQLVSSQEVLKKIENDLNKLTVIASVPGVVNYVFNTTQSSNVIGRGEILVSIAPQTDRYYAKIAIPEKDVPFIKPGMPVRLKMDAYQGMEFGLINGKVTYVSERKQDEHFFALVQLAGNNRFPLRPGYTLYGQIIVRQLPLYRYIMKKLLRGQ